MTPPQRDATLGSRLRTARITAGLSQAMVERKSGIPKSMLSRYENDHLLPSVRTLRRLSESIGISASTFFETDGSAATLDGELARRGIRFASRAEMLRVADEICEMLERERTGSVAHRPAT